MKRRSFLKALPAAGIAAALPAPAVFAASGDGPDFSVDRVAVVGAGIIGASIAWYLSRRGADVLLLDKGGPAAQASGNSFAWLNASWYDKPDSYFWLRTHSIAEYRRLAADVEFPIRWGGSLEWYHSMEEQEEMAAGVSRIQRLGAPTWMVGAERVAAIEPGVDLGGDWKAAWCSRDGAIDPAAATRALVEGVRAHGGQVVFPAEVTSLEQRKDGVGVVTNAGSFSADLVVVAAGIEANDVAAMAGIGKQLLAPPKSGIIVTTRPTAATVNTVCYTSDSHFHQLPDGRLIIGEKAGAPKTDEHIALLTERPNVYPKAELAMQHAWRVIDTASAHCPSLADAEVERVGVGWRPLPVDGLPIVGHVPDAPRVYVAAMHSGVTLAPIIGHLAAMEILDGVSVDLLSDFRIQRL